MTVWLFVPGQDERRLPKALASGADGVIVDWEDAVPASAKTVARSVTQTILSQTSSVARVFVRLNHPSSQWFTEDWQAVQNVNCAGIVLPKIESADDLQTLLPLQQPLIPMIETAIGLENVRQIAQMPFVERLLFGALDFLADIHGQWSIDGIATLYARSQLVIASRVAGIAAPLDGVFPLIQDLAGLQQESQIARKLGYAGKTIIHPSHIPIVRQIFQPTAEEISQATAIITAYQEALAENRAALKVGNQFIDPPVVRWAEDILRLTPPPSAVVPPHL